MYKRILVAVDGSNIANQALEHAIQLAGVIGAYVYAVYVIEYPSALYTSEVFDVEPFHMAMVDEATSVLEKAKARLKQANLSGEVKMIDTGNVGKSIAAALEDAVEASDIDLVIMGTHGRRGIQRLMLGSVAEAFVRCSTVPVMLVPGRSD